MTTNDKINIYIIYEIKEYLEIIIQFKIYRICIKIISSGSPEVHGWEYICDQTFSRQKRSLSKTLQARRLHNQGGAVTGLKIFASFPIVFLNMIPSRVICCFFLQNNNLGIREPDLGQKMVVTVLMAIKRRG